MNAAIVLTTEKKKTLKRLAQKPFNKMGREQRQKFLKLAAENFSNRYGETIKKLANE
jgi:ABC-type transporter MlaC component